MPENLQQTDLSREAINNIIDYIKTSLGFPVITIYITDDMIEKLIRSARRKCSSHASLSYTSLFDGYVVGGVVDLSSVNAVTVRKVYSAAIDGAGGSGSGSAGSSCSNNCDICGKLCQYRGMSDLLTEKTRLYDSLAYQLSNSELKKMSLEDFYYDSARKMLYVDGYSGAVTIEYVPSADSVDILTSSDAEWLSWIQDYSLALVKITEGRIRSKFKMPGGPALEIESDTLISEGESSKTELESKLTEGMGYWNIMRG